MPRSLQHEILERRELLAAAIEATYRSFPFQVSGAFTGDYTDTYVSCDGFDRTYRDRYNGQATVSGTVRYDSEWNAGVADSVSVTGSTRGSDTFWESYRNIFSANAVIGDSGGFYQFAPSGLNSLEYSDIEFSEACARQEPEYAPGTLPASSGSWSLTDPTVILESEYTRFEGTLQSLTTGTTDARVVEAYMGFNADTGLQCVNASFDVTGAFPMASNSQAIGAARGVLIDGFDTEVQTVFSQAVYWNTGSIDVDFPDFDLPAQGSEGLRLKVIIDMPGDQDLTNNEIIVSLQPDLVLRKLEFQSGGGVSGEYEIVGPSLVSIADVSLYWSSDDRFDSGDRMAANRLSTLLSTESPVPFSVAAVDMSTPRLQDRYLIAVIDSLLQFEECNEENNERSLALAPVIDVSAALTYPPEPLLYKSQATSMLRLTNNSPIPSDIKYDFSEEASETEIKEVSEGSPSVRVEPFTTELVQIDQQVRWEWIPQQNPIDAAVRALNDNSVRKSLMVLEAVLDDAAPFAGPIAAAVAEAKSIITGALGTFLEVGRLRDIARPEANLLINVQYQPQVAMLQPAGTGELRAAEVSKQRQDRYDAFLIKLTAIRMAAVALGVFVGRAEGGGPGSSLNLALQQLISESFAASDDYRAAYDPPNFDFESFTEPDYSAVSLAGGQLDPVAEQPVAAAIVSLLRQARTDALDRSDGASQSGDARWRLEQLASAGGYTLELFLGEAQQARIHRLLDLQLDSSGTPEEIADYWDENDAWPDDVRQAFLDAGFESTTIDDILVSVRDLTPSEIVETLEAYRSTELARLLLAASNVSAMLADIVDLRVASGLPAQSLTPEQASHVQQVRQAALDAIAQPGAATDVADRAVEPLRRWIETVWQLALDTGDLDALQPELNNAMMVLIDRVHRMTGMAAIENWIDARVTDSAIDQSLAMSLRSVIAPITETLQQRRWEDVAAAIDSAAVDINNLLQSTPAEARIDELVGLLQRLTDALRIEPTHIDPEAEVSPILRGSADGEAVGGLTWTPGRAGMIVHAGARASITLPGWSEASPFTIELPVDWSINDGVVSRDGQPIARISWDADSLTWSATSLLGSNTDDIRILLGNLQWQASSAAPSEIQTTIEIDNGAGRTMSSTPVRFVNKTAAGYVNPRLAADVNDDQQVTALDALQVINLLGRFDETPIDLDGLGPTAGPLYPDVNGDRTATALDALQVINRLPNASNAQSAAESVIDSRRAAHASSTDQPAVFGRMEQGPSGQPAAREVPAPIINPVPSRRSALAALDRLGPRQTSTLSATPSDGPQERDSEQQSLEAVDRFLASYGLTTRD